MKDDVERLTPMGVMVLALLHEGDMHPYEMMRLLRQRRDDRLVTLTNGTTYNTVARLERAGLVSEVGVDRDGNRPERTTYTLTPAGRTAVREWVRRELRRVDRPAEFRIALAEAHDLPRDEVIALLGERRAALVEQLELHESSLRTAVEREVDRQYFVEIERQAMLLRADLTWLDGFVERLYGDGMPWGVHQPTEQYFADRKAARL